MRPIYENWIIIWYEEDTTATEEQEETNSSEEETKENDEEQVDEESTEEKQENNEESDEDSIPTMEEYETENIDNDSVSEEISEDIDDLDKLLNDTLSISEEAKVDESIQSKLEESIKIINKLKKRNSELEITLAEREWLWDNYWLSPSMVIIKTNYDNAVNWNKNAIDKIKQILLTDLGLEFKTNKETIFGYDIYGSNDYKNNESNNTLGFQVWTPI